MPIISNRIKNSRFLTSVFRRELVSCICALLLMNNGVILLLLYWASCAVRSHAGGCKLTLCILTRPFTLTTMSVSLKSSASRLAHTHTHTHTHARTHTYTHTHTHTYIHILTYALTCIHTYIYTWIYAQQV